MNINVVDIVNNDNSSIEVNDNIFTRDFNSSLINQVVNAYQAGGRAGSKAQKNRSAVSGGGKKPWKQKGTGRARAGTTRGPIWRSGGVTFAAQPRSYAQKVNKKMYKGAISIIFSELLRSGRIQVVKEFDIKEAKTKSVLNLLKSLNVKDVLFISSEIDEKLYLASRNLYHVGVCDSSTIDPVSLIGYDNIVITEEALKKVEAVL